MFNFVIRLVNYYSVKSNKCVLKDLLTLHRVVRFSFEEDRTSDNEVSPR